MVKDAYCGVKVGFGTQEFEQTTGGINILTSRLMLRQTVRLVLVLSIYRAQWVCPVRGFVKLLGYKIGTFRTASAEDSSILGCLQVPGYGIGTISTTSAEDLSEAPRWCSCNLPCTRNFFGNLSSLHNIVYMLNPRLLLSYTGTTAFILRFNDYLFGYMSPCLSRLQPTIHRFVRSEILARIVFEASSRHLCLDMLHYIQRIVCSNAFMLI